VPHYNFHLKKKIGSETSCPVKILGDEVKNIIIISVSDPQIIGTD
jgi:hypothetical protein